jgi:hypothetical protein
MVFATATSVYHDGGTGLGKALGDGAADAGGGTCDDGGLAGKIDFHEEYSSVALAVGPSVMAFALESRSPNLR